MKAVFFCNGNRFRRVYPYEFYQELAAMLEIHPDVIRSDELELQKGLLQDAEAIISSWGMPALSEDQIGTYLPNLKVVFYGAGSVQEFARPFLSKGIRVSSAWAANAVPVIEFSASVIQLAMKGFFPAYRLARSNWQDAGAEADKRPGCYLAKVGLLGLGMIGRGVAEKLKGMDVDIIAYDPYVPDELFTKLDLKRADTILDAFRGSDAVSNHMANVPTTREILRYEHFSAMAEYGAFVNTGRNSQVHIPGLVQAFTEVPTRTAFFDVTDPDEPPSPGNPLLSLPNAYFSPHIAGSTGRELSRMGAYMVEECKRYLRGEPLKWEVTEKMLDTMA